MKGMYTGWDYLQKESKNYLHENSKQVATAHSGLHALLINIAKIAPRKPHRARRLRNRHRRAQHAHVQHIVQRPERTRRRTRVLGPEVARHDVGPRRGVQVLPDPPHPVNLPMMQPKHGVPGADVEVAGRVARDGEVAPAVHAQVPHAPVALHVVLEGGQVGGLGDEVGRVLLGGPARADVRGDVPADAARVVLEEVAFW